MALYVLIGCVIVAAYLLISPGRPASSIHSKFGLSDRGYSLVGSDLGGSENGLKLNRRGVVGVPDAVFVARGAKEVVVGEFKSRKFRGEVRNVELYQLLLYMGHIASQYPSHKIKGCLAYKDGHEFVNFDSAVYSALLGMREEYQDAKARKGRAKGALPLHSRMDVGSKNRHLQLVASM